MDAKERKATESPTITVIVPAAGCGARAGLNGNKILAELNGRPLLGWTLERLYSAFPIQSDLGELHIKEFVIAARPEEWDLIREAAHGLPLTPRLVEGGATRQDSVQAAVSAAQGTYVLVHDAARPCVSAAVVERSVLAAVKHRAALAAMPVSDTVKRAESGNFTAVAETLDRKTIWLAQTPQVFERELLLEALIAANQDGWQGTDCSSLVERLGVPVALTEGEVQNLKVTYAPDLARASEYLKSIPTS